MHRANANRRRFAVRCSHCQRGQSLVIGVALLVVVMLAMYHMVRSGQTIALKSRVVGAADAAAYSAAVWRARALNFTAYANRAIVFQEVAVAQAVTLAAWSRYFENFTRTAADLARAYPPVGAVLELVAQIAQYVREITHLSADAEIAARAAPDSGYKALLQASTEMMLASAGGFGLSAVANEIARANDARFFAFALPDQGEFARFTRRYESDGDRQRLASLVERSLDPFTGSPRTTDFVVWGLPAACVGFGSSASDWFQTYRKRGATVLAPGLDRWEAADTGSMHDGVRSGFFGSRCRRIETVPIGWGAREVGDEAPRGELIAYAGDILVNPRATERAVDDLSSAEHQFGSRFSGIERIRDLNFDMLSNSRFPTSRVAVLARAPGSAQALVSGALGRLRGPSRLAGSHVWALSAAEVYFRRAPGAPRRIEYASLFNPYWQARLTSPRQAERLLAESYVK